MKKKNVLNCKQRIKRGKGAYNGVRLRFIKVDNQILQILPIEIFMFIYIYH